MIKWLTKVTDPIHICLSKVPWKKVNYKSAKEILIYLVYYTWEIIQ